MTPGLMQLYQPRLTQPSRHATENNGALCRRDLIRADFARPGGRPDAAGQLERPSIHYLFVLKSQFHPIKRIRLLPIPPCSSFVNNERINLAGRGKAGSEPALCRVRAGRLPPHRPVVMQHLAQMFQALAPVYVVAGECAPERRELSPMLLAGRFDQPRYPLSDASSAQTADRYAAGRVVVLPAAAGWSFLARDWRRGQSRCSFPLSFRRISVRPACWKPRRRKGAIHPASNVWLCDGTLYRAAILSILPYAAGEVFTNFHTPRVRRHALSCPQQPPSRQAECWRHGRLALARLYNLRRI